ncbi:MAG: hypothetical protein K0M56_06770 [Kaistella sp.]|nr:hypothetical protein [Kaistella sp.]
MLFDSFERTFSGHKKRSQTAYEFLNNSSWRISNLSRITLDKFAKKYSVDNEFLKVFKSKSNKQHYAAVFELMVNAALTNSKLSLKKHPITQTGKRPDFLASSEDGRDFFLECTLSGNSFENEDEKNRKEAVEEIIDNMNYFPYWINIEFSTISKKSISKKRLVNFIGQIKSICDNYTDEELFNVYFEFEDNDWSLEISLFRKTDSNIKRSLGVISGGVRMIDKSKSLLTALNDKRATKYGIQNQSYVIGVSVNDVSISESDFTEILFGQYSKEVIDLNQLNNGFWISNGNPINSSVSAIVFFKNFNLYVLDSSEITVWHNPFAKNILDTNLLPFDEFYYEKVENVLIKNKIQKQVDIFKILGINKLEYCGMNKKDFI